MIGIMMGGAAGVGPGEITLEAVVGMSADDRAATRIFGCRTTLGAAQGPSAPTCAWGATSPAPICRSRALSCPSAARRSAGRRLRVVEAAIRAAEAGEIGCIVTAPINKAALTRQATTTTGIRGCSPPSPAGRRG